MTEEKKKPSAMEVYRERAVAISGSYINPKEVSEQLQYAAQHMHLVSPATSVGHLPPGCAITLAAVQIDPDTETYKVEGGLALKKEGLDRIAQGVGITWDPIVSRRLDDASDAHYCHFRASGRYRAFDGQWQVIVGEKEMDLREGSPQIEAMKARAKAGKDPGKQIRGQREHILSHAETKARLRAIRSIGIRSSYTREELQKPFISARVMFTGQSDNPEMQRDLTNAVASSFLDGKTSLYEDAPASSQTVELGAHTPPPVGFTASEAERGDEPEDADFQEVDSSGPPPPPHTDDDDRGGRY